MVVSSPSTVRWCSVRPSLQSVPFSATTENFSVLAGGSYAQLVPAGHGHDLDRRVLRQVEQQVGGVVAGVDEFPAAGVVEVASPAHIRTQAVIEEAVRGPELVDPAQRAAVDELSSFGHRR